MEFSANNTGMSVHEGHRDRLRNRYASIGLDGFEAHQILELLLFYAIPRRDTNELAHTLLQRFGSISGVFEAEISELENIPGMGRNSAILLSLVPSLCRRYMNDRWGDKPLLDSSVKAGEFAVSLFMGRKYEAFYALCLDNQNRLNYAALVHEGTINEAPVYPRLIVETALRHKASSVILAHNHPGGSLKPSGADIECTKRICTALEAISVHVIDHIIAAGDKYTSLAEKGVLPKSP